MRKKLTPELHELALQAGGSFYPEVNTEILHQYSMLLVKKCIEIALNSDEHNIQLLAGRCLAAAAIAEYFNIDIGDVTE